jgi:hypothetical protein
MGGGLKLAAMKIITEIVTLVALLTALLLVTAEPGISTEDLAPEVTTSSCCTQPPPPPPPDGRQ